MFDDKQTYLEPATLGSVMSFGTSTARLMNVEGTQRTVRDRNLPDRLVVTSLLCDCAVIIYALLSGFWVRFYTEMRHVGVFERVHLGDYAGYIVMGALSLMFTLANFQLYQRGTLLRFRQVAMLIIKACTIWFIGFLLFSLLFKFQPSISRMFVTISALNVTAGLLGWRWCFHRFLQRSAVAASLQQRVLFVGWNDDASRLAKDFRTDKGSAYDVVGCVQLPDCPIDPSGEAPVLGGYDDLPGTIRSHSVDIVILSDLNLMRGQVVGLANLCEKEMVQFKVIPSYFQILVSGLHLETVSGIPILGVSQLPLDRFFPVLLKRCVDIVGATVGLICSAPLLLLFGAIVYWESPGPIFYRQRRMGRGGLPFDIIKIRSMRLDAETTTGARWAQKDDPRRLRVGAWMREWNIDEVPQFWNVLKGEMSLVGPRPERPELIENFKDEIPHYNARHNAKPGITGWAQVKGLRGDTDLSERINCDLWYLENWNVVLDFQIMVMTFFNRQNAY
jgi:exopolysaccharide biosynthesis polyprenyl glycosylphosphotransferase